MFTSYTRPRQFDDTLSNCLFCSITHPLSLGLLSRIICLFFHLLQVVSELSGLLASTPSEHILTIQQQSLRLFFLHLHLLELFLWTQNKQTACYFCLKVFINIYSSTGSVVDSCVLGDGSRKIVSSSAGSSDMKHLFPLHMCSFIYGFI